MLFPMIKIKNKVYDFVKRDFQASIKVKQKKTTRQLAEIPIFI